MELPHAYEARQEVGAETQPGQALVHSEKALLKGTGGKGTKLTQDTC